MPRTRVALSLLLLAACPVDDEAPAGGSTSSGSAGESTGSDDTGTEDTGPGSGTVADGSGSATTAGETGAVGDEPCSSWCAQDEACDGPDPECVESCEILRQYRAEYYDAGCQAATDARLQCESDAACDDLSTCYDAGFDEIEACTTGGMPSPDLVAFCTMIETCTGGPSEECIVSFLDYNVFEAYQLGCVAEHDALLACLAALDCTTYMTEGEAACPTEVAAFEAACPDFGR